MSYKDTAIRSIVGAAAFFLCALVIGKEGIFKSLILSLFYLLIFIIMSTLRTRLRDRPEE